MTISRRDAIAVSGSAIVGLSVGGLDPKELAAQVAGQEQEFPDRLIDVEPRATFPVDLPLNPDGSAPEHPESAAGPTRGRLMWRTSDRMAPEIEYDSRGWRSGWTRAGLAPSVGRCGSATSNP